MARHLHIDPFSGIAGDMFLGATIHLGLPLEDLIAALAPLPIEPPPQITARPVIRHGIAAIDVKVSHPSLEHHHHDHGRQEIRAMVDAIDLAERAKQRARAIVDRLADAEARVHARTPDEVHFHEVGAVDSTVDMLGAAVALELLDVDSVSCGPLPISRGMVRCQHGRMPVPAPATAYLMEGLATVGVDRTGELVTPTGAAIVAALCDHTGPPPPMTVEKVGYGAGDREDPDVPNLLRLILGETR
jgi:hypothetical protein